MLNVILEINFFVHSNISFAICQVWLLYFPASGLGVPGRRYGLGEYHRGFSLSGAG